MTIDTNKGLGDAFSRWANKELAPSVSARNCALDPAKMQALLSSDQIKWYPGDDLIDYPAPSDGVLDTYRYLTDAMSDVQRKLMDQVAMIPGGGWLSPLPPETEREAWERRAREKCERANPPKTLKNCRPLREVIADLRQHMDERTGRALMVETPFAGFRYGRR